MSDDVRSSTVPVAIRGVVRVPMRQQVLETLDDPMLRRDIATTAVRVALADRMGTFDEMRITPSAELRPHQRAALEVSDGGEMPQFVAEIEFDSLCASIMCLQHEYDRVVAEAAKAKEALQSAVAAAITGAGSNDGDDAPDLVGHLESAAGCLDSILAGGPPAAIPASSTEQANERWQSLNHDHPQEGEGGSSSDDDGDDSADASDGAGGDPDELAARMGYVPLLDGEDD